MTPRRRTQVSWALYDWANSAFATTVMAGFFPIFFSRYWAMDMAPGERTYWQGWAGSLSSIVVMVLAPVLGGFADRTGTKKRFLFFFTLLGAGGSASLFALEQGQWQAALVIFSVASIGFFAAISMYDALIVHVARPDEMDRVSALGYGLGYLGGGVLFAVNVLMVLKPSLFGFADAAIATRASFLMVGAWWLLFSLPLFRFVPETPHAAPAIGGFADLWETLKELVRIRAIWMFLLAYWLYIDGVDTIIRMAVDYGVKLGFSSSSLITALLLVQFIGFPAAIAFGWLGDRIGTRRAIFLALGIYVGVTCWAYFLQTEFQFYCMAAVIGLVQGGIQSLSRSYYARLIPAEKAGRYFGFYNMLGKFAMVLGPLAVGYTAIAFEDQRLSILSLLPFFIVGGILLARVPKPEPSR
jgi:UMF1 family MFS transporter